MKNPHSSCSDKDRPRLLKNMLLGTLKIHCSWHLLLALCWSRRVCV